MNIRSLVDRKNSTIFLIVGITCETKCQTGFYGEDCSNQCRCYNNSTCDAQTGGCICNKGWRGPECLDPCEDGYYGLGMHFLLFLSLKYRFI